MNTTKKPKIFGIGAHKTGTSSLKTALEILGYKVCGEFGINNPNIESEAMATAVKFVSEYDAFQDNPWPVLYKDLDQRFPGSKFILTLRDREQWIGSVLKHFGRTDTEMRKWIYGVGCPNGNEQIYLQWYDSHNAEVMEYFSKRPNDLLIMRITEGDGWKPLCNFLGMDLPDKLTIPHRNKGANENRGLHRIKKGIQRHFFK